MNNISTSDTDKQLQACIYLYVNSTNEDSVWHDFSFW